MNIKDLAGNAGRRVLVETVLSIDTPDSDGDVRVSLPFRRAGKEVLQDHYVNPKAIREILPEPIKVGDRVFNRDLNPCVVTTLFEDQDIQYAVLKTDTNGLVVQTVSEILKIEDK